MIDRNIPIYIDTRYICQRQEKVSYKREFISKFIVQNNYINFFSSFLFNTWNLYLNFYLTFLKHPLNSNVATVYRKSIFNQIFRG